MDYSILMTVYKSDNPLHFYLALNSMINQTKKAEEIIIVKDGPITIELQQVINNALSIANIIQIQLDKNIGLGLALNIGLEQCKNELIARMDADDISLPERCEIQIKEFEKNSKLDTVGLPAFEFEDNPEKIIGVRKVPLTNEQIYKYAKTRDPFNHPTVMYKKSKVLEVGGYGDFRKNQDTDLWIKMLSNNAVCMNIDKHLFNFRFDANTYKKRKNWINTKLLIAIRFTAYRIGFCSFFDFVRVLIAQVGVFLLPTFVQEFIYKNILR